MHILYVLYIALGLQLLSEAVGCLPHGAPPSLLRATPLNQLLVVIRLSLSLSLLLSLDAFVVEIQSVVSSLSIVGFLLCTINFVSYCLNYVLCLLFVHHQNPAVSTCSDFIFAVALPPDKTNQQNNHFQRVCSRDELQAFRVVSL